MGLVALIFGKRKKGSKVGMFLVLVLVTVSVGMTLAGCNNGGSGDATPAPTPAEQPPVVITPGPDTVATPTGTATPPIQPPDDGCPTPFGIPIGKFIMSAYYLVGEDQYTDAGGITAVPASGNAKTATLGAGWGDYIYLSKDGPNSQYPYTKDSEKVLRARYSFLYDPEGICVQGTGKLTDEHGGYYIHCPQSLVGIDLSLGAEIQGIGFEWQTQEALGRVVDRDFEVVAVCYGVIPYGTEISIPALDSYLKERGKDINLTVTDSGERLCTETEKGYNTIDLYVGAGENALKNHANPLNNLISGQLGPVEVYRK